MQSNRLFVNGESKLRSSSSWMGSSSRLLGVCIGFVALNGLFNNQTRLYLQVNLFLAKINITSWKYNTFVYISGNGMSIFWCIQMLSTVALCVLIWLRWRIWYTFEYVLNLYLLAMLDFADFIVRNALTQPIRDAWISFLCFVQVLFMVGTRLAYIQTFSHSDHIK